MDVWQSRKGTTLENIFTTPYSLNPPNAAGFRHQPPESREVHGTGLARVSPDTTCGGSGGCTVEWFSQSLPKAGTQAAPEGGTAQVTLGRHWFPAHVG